MKTKETTPGKTYSVHTSSGCTVSDQNGWSKTIDAPDGYFTAHAAEVTIDGDDNATVKELFKLAPAKLRLLGLLGGGVSFALPSGYFAAEFLESTGTQYINTEIVPSASVGLEAEYQIKSTSGRQNVIGSQQIGGSTLFILMGAGYGWNNTRAHVKQSTYGKLNWNGNLIYDNGETQTELPELNFVPKLPMFMFALHYANGVDELTSLQLKKAKIADGSALVRDFVPTIDPTGEPCMYDKVSKQPFYNKGTGQFIVGMTLSQARKLANLPDGGGTLTVSLPWEAQLIASGVPEALQAAADKGWTITVQYSERDMAAEIWQKYAGFTSGDELKAAYPKFYEDLTDGGGWYYPLTSMKTHADWFFKGNAKYAEFDIPEVTKSVRLAASTSLEECVINAPKLTVMYYAVSRQLKKLSGYFPELSVSTCAFDGNKLREVYAEFPKLTSGSRMFYGGEMDKPSALRVINSLPSYSSGSHPLTIGIHVDHELDEEVAAAIANAEANGWTIEEQWNGTATAQTASTWGLRRKPIYAKVSEYEGEQRLDWGHYVTNWEENGYQEFSSVEEAKEYFNIGD